MGVDVSGGQFIAEAGGYKPYSSGGKVGAEMSLRFKPLPVSFSRLSGCQHAPQSVPARST